MKKKCEKCGIERDIRRQKNSKLCRACFDKRGGSLFHGVEWKCTGCGLTRRERASVAARRKFCRSCWLAKIRLTAKSCIKYHGPGCVSCRKNSCLQCQKPVLRFFCSNKCQQIFRYSQRVNLWLEGKLSESPTVLSHLARQWLIKTIGEKCSRCGWSERNEKTGKVPIEIDHIDGNSENNSPKNVRLLCPNCHSLTPTYKALNIGHGRKDRYKSKEIELAG
jgi:hypothetical protein